MANREERLVVTLSGGCPWGFRLQGGAGTGLPLIVSKVRRKSKAYRRLREGDRILSVNGRFCEGFTYDQLMDIADKGGTDLTLEILRRECDKENLAPHQESAVKTIHEMDSKLKELVSFTETSTKMSEEKEGLRIKSVTVVPESKAFETFTSSKLEQSPAEKTSSQVVESFPSFKDLTSEPRADMSTSSKKEYVSGDDKNYTKTIVETKHEVKGGTETSFIKKEQESFSKSTNDSHGLPDITMDTIDLNNLISETQKRLESFKNNFKTNGILDNSLNEIKKTKIGFQSSSLNEITNSGIGYQDSSVSDMKRSTGGMQDISIGEITNIKTEYQDSSVSDMKRSTGGMQDTSLDEILNTKIGYQDSSISDMKKSTVGMQDTSLSEITNTKIGYQDSSISDMKKATGGMQDISVSDLKKTEIISSSTTSETKTFESSNILNEKSVEKISSESTGLEKNAESVFSKQTDAVKKIPPPTLPKPKIRPNPCLDAFNECFKEMKTDSIFSLPDLGFTSQSLESSSITTDIPFGTSTTHKKKMFSSSSFYEEPHSIYPTVEEQVEMARKIADSLADDTNKKSKGANMFYKRVKRSSKWIHEGPEPSDESAPGTPEVQGVEPPTPDPSLVPFRPSKGPQRLKLVLDPRHPLDINALRSSGYIISEHNVVSPEVCHGLVKDLHSPVGKGAALFAKRKKKSEEWVVDAEKVKALLREQERRFVAPPLTTSPAMSQYSSLNRQESIKLVKTPWEAAMESPFGFCDSAFARVNPDKLADTVIRAADTKRSESLSRESSRMEGCITPPVPPPLTPAAQLHDIYHAKAPKGWAGSIGPMNYSSLVSSAPLPQAPSTMPQRSTNNQTAFQQSKKMVFQNFNAVPKLWKGASVH